MKHQIKILIAEDSPTQATRLQYILEEQGYQVVATRNGREALEALESNEPTLLITDINMPEMDGYELCRRIRKNAKYAALPVILLTSLSDPADVFTGLECGADNFVVKPYEEDNLLARIEYLLANLHLRTKEVTRSSLEVVFAGRPHSITSDRSQILNLLLSTYETAVQKNRQLSEARDDLSRLNEQLEQKVRDRTALLAAEVAERKRAEEQVRELNNDLESRVLERTEQLSVANKELESFSYSVSHDLRAPLRHVIGFSSILKESTSDALDDKNRKHLDHIIESVNRMSLLIDDLLEFSRMGRTELRTMEISLDQVLQDSLRDLDNEANGRKISWKIAPLGKVYGDPSMLRQVYVNLVGNAVKFTRKKPEAIIEIGRTDKGDESVFFVRDNGAGFDMEYADKLFGVFQRLHSQEAFEGTGIGLANVQRILKRHGGKIWAESAVDQGTTFYFTLPLHAPAEPSAKPASP